ncbi:MAG: M48 family metalloprotease, partial [Planctomycetes bacterium]|nr:M48 family metalloprotease [Planctomycetota bacterium]
MSGETLLSHITAAAILLAPLLLAVLLLRHAATAAAARRRGAEIRCAMPGELLDRARALARAAGVDLEGIAVYSSPGRTAPGALALGRGWVAISEDLLRMMSRRELDTILAHEIAHVRLGHLRRRRLLLAGCLAICAALLVASPIDWLRVPGPLVWLLLAVWAAAVASGAMLLSRRQERAADLLAAELTGDPEAVVSSLVKLSRMGRLPFRRGVLERWLGAHPSAESRALAVARRWGL